MRYSREFNNPIPSTDQAGSFVSIRANYLSAHNFQRQSPPEYQRDNSSLFSFRTPLSWPAHRTDVNRPPPDNLSLSATLSPRLHCSFSNDYCHPANDYPMRLNILPRKSREELSGWEYGGFRLRGGVPVICGYTKQKKKRSEMPFKFVVIPA
jgi:hypothetical protein